ncbi:hypothetical protein E2C01_017335 [Portunus trituberculatus]|uniref:Uncharacterized protein n=1 Tax=Portunus trituberculatus TaxID=210409 RepID=A0A5B7DSL1_PORTR|nr:hypothetical protein [Portunus trituberculatus]
MSGVSKPSTASSSGLLRRNSIPYMESSMFSGMLNCCRMPPTESTVEAFLYCTHQWERKLQLGHTKHLFLATYGGIFTKSLMTCKENKTTRTMSYQREHTLISRQPELMGKTQWWGIKQTEDDYHQNGPKDMGNLHSRQRSAGYSWICGLFINVQWKIDASQHSLNRKNVRGYPSRSHKARQRSWSGESTALMGGAQRFFLTTVNTCTANGNTSLAQQEHPRNTSLYLCNGYRGKQFVTSEMLVVFRVTHSLFITKGCPYQGHVLHCGCHRAHKLRTTFQSLGILSLSSFSFPLTRLPSISPTSYLVPNLFLIPFAESLPSTTPQPYTHSHTCTERVNPTLRFILE